MKNILIIDGAENCVYDIFSATEEEFALVFPAGMNIAFIDKIYANGDAQALDKAFNNIWLRSVKKCQLQGIHGNIFYGID